MPTTCMHCWALGRDYRPMPIGDAAFFLDELSGFCRERGLGYTAYPMHEVTVHTAAPDMIRLFAPHLGQGYDRARTADLRTRNARGGRRQHGELLRRHRRPLPVA
jgi:hypothetical protein